MRISRTTPEGEYRKSQMLTAVEVSGRGEGVRRITTAAVVAVDRMNSLVQDNSTEYDRLGITAHT